MSNNLKNPSPLRSARLKTGMTQQALAIKAGIGITTVNRLEVYPELMPTWKIANRLSSALGCQTSELWSYEQILSIFKEE